MKSTVSGVFEDFKFKISEGYLQAKLRGQGRDRKTSILVQAFWNLKLKVFKYAKVPHATVISNFGEIPTVYLLMAKKPYFSLEDTECETKLELS